jgi:rod shape-determining protein MreC
MLNLVTRYRHISLFVLLVLISLTLLSLNRPADTTIPPTNLLEQGMLLLLQPFQNTVSRFLGKIQDTWQSYIALVQLQEKNQLLQQENKLLRAQNTFHEEQIRAYERLKDTLVFLEERQFATIAARVIGYDPTNQTHTIIVNKGADDGVRESWPVITQDGIAGITVGVSKHSTKVLLLIDPSCNVAALIQRTRDQGIVGGQSKKDAYLMKYVNRRAIIREGVIYQLSDAALQQIAQEGFPGYRMTDQSLLTLKEAGLPADILILLEELKNLLYVSQSSFLHAIETHIGKEQTDWFKPIFLQHSRADLLAKLHQIKEQTFATRDEFLQALEVIIGADHAAHYQEMILKHAEEQEIVLSSGLGGIFPKGLRIGTVSKVIKQDYGLFQDIEVTPSVDFSKLEEVLIIIRNPDETDS